MGMWYLPTLNASFPVSFFHTIVFLFSQVFQFSSHALSYLPSSQASSLLSSPPYYLSASLLGMSPTLPVIFLLSQRLSISCALLNTQSVLGSWAASSSYPDVWPLIPLSAIISRMRTSRGPAMGSSAQHRAWQGGGDGKWALVSLIPRWVPRVQLLLDCLPTSVEPLLQNDSGFLCCLQI